MQWWSWILTAVGVLGLYLAGRGSMWGWAVGLGAQGLWIAYALSTEQHGFLVSAGAYSWVYLKNFRAWKKKAAAKDAKIPGSRKPRDAMRAWRKP